MDQIFIKQLRVDAIIGVYDQERNNKQPLFIDLKLSYEDKQAAVSDDIQYAIDYHQLSLDVKKHIEQSRFYLIEALAESTAATILKNKRIKEVDISLYKPQALAGIAENVGINIIRTNRD